MLRNEQKKNEYLEVTGIFQIVSKLVQRTICLPLLFENCTILRGDLLVCTVYQSARRESQTCIRTCISPSSVGARDLYLLTYRSSELALARATFPRSQTRLVDRRAKRGMHRPRVGSTVAASSVYTASTDRVRFGPSAVGDVVC